MGNIKTKLKITNNLHVLRAEKKLTQQALADAIGVTRLTVNSMEKGNYNPSLELAFRLAIYFEKDIKDIFTVESKNEKSIK
ncbi:MAG: helix-turn-helix transcriptional regulator [Bacteriovoracaceae bacterium]|jgi:putative transcriptional regulator|nr:transcriptional regulator [Halobacteriovoraceae bacterium]MDP7321212.1 helix-turn-helix transcriptional regulator [Bacteriovoracaceae bacterium]|tara:strand:+ start:244 stop:486 length:243 start_codon:yes stop_codon:yes gene_type:complete